MNFFHRYNIRLKILIGILMMSGLAGCSVTQSLPLYRTLPAQSSGSATPISQNTGSIVGLLGILIALLLIATLVSTITDRLRIPYTIGLVLVGLGLTFVSQIPKVQVTPELILALLVPPLVYEAAFYLNYSDLRRELRLVLLLAVPGVILTTLLVGGLVSIGAGLALPYALVFGALVSATDPVAVVALFRSMGAPTRLQVLLEGESLLNDGTAIVIFNLMLVIALTGKLNLPGSLVQFAIVSGGGIAVGAVVGFLVSHLISKINHPMVETSLTTVIAYGSYLLAEYVFGFSGVLAVVAAGLASGEMGPQGMSPTTRIAVFHFWEYAAFLANTFIFLIIGLETDPANLLRNIPAILWAIAAVLIARAAVVYGLSSLRRDIPIQWKNILFWGGLRGAICLALALSLSTAMPNRSQIQAMAFGVVLFTLLVQGLTMRPLVKNSITFRSSDAQMAYERNHASAIALRAASDHLNHLNQEGVISKATLARLQPVLEGQIASMTDKAHHELETNPVLFQEELAMAWVESLRVRRTTLTTLFHDHIISEENYLEMASHLDLLLADPENAWREIQPEIEPPKENSSPKTT